MATLFTGLISLLNCNRRSLSNTTSKFTALMINLADDRSLYQPISNLIKKNLVNILVVAQQQSNSKLKLEQFFIILGSVTKFVVIF